MRVSRLEVFGFKSFMNRLMLPLEGGITGVVGPNGCGKSNIVDALRWVLGETRASNLRGELLEDVIFNGTDKLRPLGLAEVSITLRSRGDNFFSDLLTPLDVLRLETGDVKIITEAAAEEPQRKAIGFNSIGLKVIDGFKGPEGNSNTPDEPKLVQTESPAARSEEIAEGEESQIEDEATPKIAPALLNRFAWLKSTSEVQITRRLYRSGESEFFLNRVPCKLKDIKDLLRAVGLGPRSYTIVAQGEVGRIVSARPEERRAIIEEAAGVLGIKERIGAAKRRLEETRGNLTRLDDVISEVTRQVNSLKRQATRAEGRAELKSRLQYLDETLLVARLNGFDESITAIESRLTELQTKEQSLSSQVSTRKVEEETARNQLSIVEAQGDAIRLEVDQIREEIHRKKRLLFEQESRLNQLNSAVTMKREEAATNLERAEGLKARRIQLELELSEAQREFESVSSEVASLEKGNDDELRSSAQALNAAREALRAVDAKLRTTRENHLRTQTRASEVEKQIVSSSPLAQIQRTLGERSPLTEALKLSSRPFSDALRVPAELTTAVRAALGERAGFLVTDAPFELAQIAEQGDLGAKKAGFCLGLVRSGPGDGPASELVTSAQQYGGLTPLASLISVADWGQRAIEELLANVLFAETAADAIAFFQTAHDEQGHKVRRQELVVTRKGELFTADSFFIFNHEGGVLELKVRSEQLQTELKVYEVDLAKCTADRDAAAASVEAAELRNKNALAESQARQATMRALLNRQGNARGRLDATERSLKQTIADTERAEAAVISCTSRIAESEHALAEVTTKIAEMKSADSSESEAKLEQLNAAYKALDVQRSTLRTAVSTAANVTSELQRDLDFTRREISRTDLDQQKIQLERQHVADTFAQAYGQEAFAALTSNPESSSALSKDAFSEFEKESGTIRARIIREGDVDPTTIEQYKTENDRLSELLNQHADLTSAVETLSATVVSLEEASVERFVNTFRSVARHFELLIPRLFGGGKGELVLTSPETPLQSGVEIMVRPPGKKPKSIELLSGGEKALCATAMIFAMFLVRPSPLCVLDEVDAPLDEANLVRLLTLIKEMSHKTQFLMITHNKQSMSMADNLVGVTMQDPGSTQILTVSLQDAITSVG